MKKNYIGISRDHSGSMQSISRAAARDYNDNIASIKEASFANNQITSVSVVEADSTVRRVILNTDVQSVQPLNENHYRCSGMTPLFDSVGDLIEQFHCVPDFQDPEVSFVIMATTDGAENASRKYTAQILSDRIRKLQETDRWTFVFRVPRGYSANLIRLGIPAGNIREWDQTEQGVQAATIATRSAFTDYYTARSNGARSTRKFYADMSNVTSKDVEVALTDISPEVHLWPVSAKDDGVAIREFVEKRLNGSPLLKGASFYQLTKTEPEVQDYKRIIIRDKTTNAIYEGLAARKMLGLPLQGSIRLAPGNFGNFDLFIQSTSVNRKMTKGTNLVYWAKVGVKFKEGPSAR